MVRSAAKRPQIAGFPGSRARLRIRRLGVLLRSASRRIFPGALPPDLLTGRSPRGTLPLSIRPLARKAG